MRIVVIGAGATGLSTAILLARFGHTVTVVEKNPRPAPLLRGFTRDGLHFDTGFHLGGGLQPGGVLNTWLKVLGVMPLLHTTLMQQDSAFLFHFPDGTRQQLPCGFEAIRQMTARHFPGHEKTVAKLLQNMDAEVHASPYMSSTPGSTGISPENSGASMSVSQKLAMLPPVLATMLASTTLLYGVQPDSSTWKQFSVVSAPFLQMSCMLEGGGKSLACALESKAREMGVALQCGQGAQRLEISSDKILRAVWLENDICLPCDMCIFTGHPGQLPDLTAPGTFRPAYLNRIAELEETLFPLLLFGETRSPFLDGRTLYLTGGTSPDDLFSVKGLEQQTAHVVCGHAHTDGRRPLMAVTTCPPLPKDADGYKAAKTQMTERFAASIRSRCSELKDFAVLDASTAKTLRRWVYGSSGSLYGVCHGKQCGELQPATRIKGLLLAGQNILLPGVLGCIISAAVVTGLIVGQQLVFEEYARCVENE